ncbi:hypothetical protein GDO86_002703 [Hymenochirus boettgeri]|uniref:Ig-like domain-containing protein n=1 Tax=Hymenochirus boettgeri TaxID=247094 RepID=A0A8T2K1E9_9PIPI|nr:hypothetical protein GDO86_002703 [Hymenochirus boettgeri]
MNGTAKFWSKIRLKRTHKSYGLTASIILGPSDVTVLSGSNATFQCIVGPSWTGIMWVYQNVSIVNITPKETNVASNGIIAQNSTNSVTGDFSSIITLLNVKKSNSGIIQCYSLSSVLKEATLTVQVSGTLSMVKDSYTVSPNTTVNVSCEAFGWFPPPTMTWKINNTDSSDYTTVSTEVQGGLYDTRSTLTLIPQGNTSLVCVANIATLGSPISTTVNVTVKASADSTTVSNRDVIIIAVTVSVCGFLLLIVIIVIIIICCRRKKQRDTSYQSTTW